MSLKNNEEATAAGPPPPTPDEIVSLAQSMGYEERRESVSSTLFFIERNPAPGKPACLLNIFYTTRSIMTKLEHDKAGSNELWRSNAYDTLEDLRALLENPRQHTGKGYRRAQQAVRGCVGCGMLKTRKEFSNNQWIKGPDANRCIECLAKNNNNKGGGGAEATNDKAWNKLTSGIENLTLQDDGSFPTLTRGVENLTLQDDALATDLENLTLQDEFPTLTENALQTHNKKVNKLKGKGGDKNNLERRQFNCPDCPKYGRGSCVFFKKVPALKPICKCPRCKKASRGRCKRIYPVPKETEKGYGLYKCTRCGDKWGSSRAVANIGQECFSCAKQGEQVLVTPFRLEAHKKKKGGGGRRVPNEPIGEDQVDERGYGDADRARNESGGGFGGGGGEGGGDSYSFEPRERVFDDDASSSNSRVLPVGASASRVPSGYQHKCAGCARGLCKNRKLPFSQVHDVSDGNTVSTSASIVTNSSIDKTDFVDRDEDFSGFEEKTDSDWVAV